MAPPADSSYAARPCPVKRRAALNIQFSGADDLSDESKSSLGDLIESIQAGVVQITTSSGSASGFVITSDGLVITNERVVSGESNVAVWTSNLTEQLYACKGGWNEFGMQPTSQEAVCIVPAGLESPGVEKVHDDD